MDDLINLKKEYVEEIDIRNITEEEYKELFNYILNSYNGHMLTIKINDSEDLTLSSPLLLSYQKQRDAEVKGLKEQHIEDIKKIESEVYRVFNEQAQLLRGQEEKIKDRDKKAIAQGRTIAEQEKRIRLLEAALKQVRLERDNLDGVYTGYILEIENKLKEAEEEIKVLKDKDTAPSGDSVVRGNGKASELTTRQIKDVVRLWCLGGSINAISKESGASWGQVSRLVKGQLKNKSSKKKIIKAVNYLLKVNQNKDFIDKLKIIKTMYS